ncbi:hypothetical protein NE237_008914 [Protea cynaroides]|uniref:Ribosomal protein S1 n=1 Tax=Protea cynaroides TaxID=273540 RepID=A0A9Q0R050_9MAGN|nr:hypothetical protein NE237_008914 [Protea cynaroides]
MFLVDAGPGTPRICMQDEPTGVPINRATRFENKVGSLDLVVGESLIKVQILERFFINLVAGESLIKERAAARFNDLVGSIDVVAGEPLLLLPRRFRKNRAWMELNMIWRMNTQVSKKTATKETKNGIEGIVSKNRMEYQPSEENDRGGHRPAQPQGSRRPRNTISQRISIAFIAAIPAPRSSDGDGTTISFSVYKTTYAPAPTSGSAHHTFGLAHHYKAAASASPCFRTSYSSASARSTESTTIGYSMA